MEAVRDVRLLTPQWMFGGATFNSEVKIAVVSDNYTLSNINNNITNNTNS